MGQPVVYFEIVGKDREALRSFYSELFGWDIAPGADQPGLRLRRSRDQGPGSRNPGAVAGVPERPSSTWALKP
jgi:predicted enzyme related to lactoylglutathione lyase